MLTSLLDVPSIPPTLSLSSLLFSPSLSILDVHYQLGSARTAKYQVER